LGQPLNLDYLIDRKKLIDKFSYRLATMGQKNADELHMGCLNGTLLKEVVVYRSKQLKIRERRTRKVTRDQLSVD